MTVRDIQKILRADLLCEGDHLDAQVHTACGSDTYLRQRFSDLFFQLFFYFSYRP